MTNEELVQRIQDGDKDLILELWRQVRRFAWTRAARVQAALNGTRIADMDDLMQVAFLGMLEAIQRFDTASGWKFTTYLVPALQNAFAEATGYRTAKQRSDPMRRAYSLDAPMGNDDTVTFGAQISDPVDRIEEANERVFREELAEFFRVELSKLPPEQAETLRLRFWEERTQKEISERSGISPAAVRQLEQKALRALRQPGQIQRMRQYVDLQTDYYRGGRDPVAENVCRREELERRFLAR